MKQLTHESFSRGEGAVGGSDRSFGFVMATATTVLALLNGWNDGRAWFWMIGVALLCLATALIYPAALGPLNRMWLRFGMLLHKIISPIVLGLMFYVAVMPTGLIMRALGKDLLRLKRQPDANSYWIVRQPPGPAPDTMKDQF